LSESPNKTFKPLSKVLASNFVKGIPDVLEAELYRMTVRLVLNMIYSSIGAMHGAEFLAGHRMELKRRRETADEAATSRLFLKENSGIDEAILEQVADRLLQNSAVNYTAIPDFVERQIYGNCLKLVFRLLDTLANTFCINICGHELRIYFDPIKPSMVDLDHLPAVTPGVVTTQSSKSRINIEVLTAQLSSRYLLGLPAASLAVGLHLGIGHYRRCLGQFGNQAVVRPCFL
jgi:hypothetical protein